MTIDDMGQHLGLHHRLGGLGETGVSQLGSSEAGGGGGGQEAGGLLGERGRHQLRGARDIGGAEVRHRGVCLLGQHRGPSVRAGGELQRQVLEVSTNVFC